MEASMEAKSGIELIQEERTRQIEEKGWTAQEDDKHQVSELVSAGVSYAMLGIYPKDSNDYRVMSDNSREVFWPWSVVLWKPKNRLANLVRAGALIAAAIDRLQREVE